MRTASRRPETTAAIAALRAALPIVLARQGADDVRSVDDFVESYHSRNGLSRDRLTPEAAAAFDAEMRAAVAPFRSDDDTVELHISATVTWGRPRS